MTPEESIADHEQRLRTVQTAIDEFRGAAKILKWLCGGSLITAIASALYMAGVMRGDIQAHERDLPKQRPGRLSRGRVRLLRG